MAQPTISLKSCAVAARVLVLVGVFLAVASGVSVEAQGVGCQPSIRASVGGLQPYLDEPWQAIASGAVRVCVAGRLSVEPEVARSSGSHYERWYVVPNVIVDLRGPGHGVTPYAIGGVGFARERDTYVTWRRDYAAWYGGIGVRLAFQDRWVVVPEFRLGDDEGRLTVGLGYQFGRQ